MPNELSQELVRDFVMAGHGNFEKVKELLEKEPRLLNEVFLAADESALQAASHVGNRDIAQYLLDHGASMNIYTAAMFGDKTLVEDFLADNPELAKTPGVHGLSLLYHVAINGSTELADLVATHGGAEQIGLELHPAISRGHVEMVRWLLEHGADTSVTNYQGKTPLKSALDQNQEAIAELLSQY